MSGAEGQGDNVGNFLDQLLKPTMQPQPQPQMRAMPVAPGTPATPVAQGAMAPALPTVQQAQGRSLPVPPAYVEEADARGLQGTARDEVEGGVGANIPWGQIITATLGAGGAGMLLDSLLRGGSGATPPIPGAAPDTASRGLPAPDTALQGDVIPPTQQRITGTNPQPPTIDATKKPAMMPSQAQLNAPAPTNQLDEVMQPRLTEAPALPPAAIPLKDANNMKAPIASQIQQGGMPQMASGEQAQVGKYYGDSSVPNTSKSPTFDQTKTSRVDSVITEELNRRGLTMEQLPQSAQNRLKDGNFMARAGSGPDKMEALRKFIRGLKIVK